MPSRSSNSDGDSESIPNFMQPLEPTQTPVTQSPKSELRKRIDAAWPDERIQSLGETQAKRLATWVERDRVTKGEEYLTVPVLQGLLEMLETYYPEESSRVLPI